MVYRQILLSAHFVVVPPGMQQTLADLPKEKHELTFDLKRREAPRRVTVGPELSNHLTFAKPLKWGNAHPLKLELDGDKITGVNPFNNSLMLICTGVQRKISSSCTIGPYAPFELTTLDGDAHTIGFGEKKDEKCDWLPFALKIAVKDVGRKR